MPTYSAGAIVIILALTPIDAYCDASAVLKAEEKLLVCATAKVTPVTVALSST